MLLLGRARPERSDRGPRKTQKRRRSHREANPNPASPPCWRTAVALRVLPGDPSHWGLPSPLPGGAVFLVGACVLWVPSALRAVEMGWGGRCPGDQQGVIPGGEKGPRAQRCARPGVPSPGRPSEHVASREGVGRIAPLAGRCGGAADVGEPELCGTADSPVLLGRSPGPEGTTSPGGSGSVPGPFNEGPHLVVPHHTRL